MNTSASDFTKITYCQFCNQLPSNTTNPNKTYHDQEYGFPVSDDNTLFERLALEINQAGLSWTTVLKKRLALRIAYAHFDINQVATFGVQDVTQLLNNPSIIRHKLKIQAIVYNAQQIQHLQQQYGSFKNWLDNHSHRTKEQWITLFKKHFKFVGNEIVNEFLLSTGYLPDAHDTNCPINKEILQAKAKI